MQVLGAGRLRIRGVGDEEDHRAILDWVAGRDEVLAVTTAARRGDDSTASIEVVHRDPRGAGAFLRALRDRIFTLRAPARPASAALRATVAHAVSGRVRLRVEGDGDDDALVRLAASLADLPGVTRASASPASRSIVVAYEPDRLSHGAILAAALASDPAAWPAPKTNARAPALRAAWLNTAVLGLVASGVAPLPVAGGAVIATAIPSARRALAALREGRLSVDVLDLAAIGISIGAGAPMTGALITWLLGAGDVVLAHTADRARAAISRLMKLDATTAWRIRGDVVEEVPVKRLAVGDRIVIEPGGRVAADGVVVRGEASVDEKALTGESMPRTKRPGDRVLAATVVTDGEIVVDVDRTGVDTTAAKIVQILEGAGTKPMTLQRTTERLADRLVVPTFGVAGTAAVVAGEIERMTSVLITDFGTGIRIAVPTSALTAMTLAARAGVLVKGGQYLERLAKADVVVFDKTGTLTVGEPAIVGVDVQPGFDAGEVIALAAAAEARHTHPIATAIREHARRLGVEPRDADVTDERYAVGIGLEARVSGRPVLVGGARLLDRARVRFDAARGAIARHRDAGASSVMIAVDGRIAAVVGYADPPRRESEGVVKALRAGGRREVILLSGDASAPVLAVGRAVGVDRAVGELLPEEKAAYVRALQAEGRTVAMVGDGINDAPALALADVGISLDGGTEVALETADVVLRGGGLAKLPLAFAIGDEAMARVRRGLGIVVAPNAAAIVLGAIGLLSPGAAALVNNGSTVVAALAAIAPLLRPAR